MNTSVDYFGYPELPYLVLTNPNKEEIYSLGLAYDTKLTLRFNALSEFTFVFPQSIDGGVTELEAYEYIQNKRLILLEGYGYFQITEAEDDLDGSVPRKIVTCQSLEVELINKRVTSYSGTKALYDPITPSGTVLGDMLTLAPNWSVASVDGSLITKFRTFKIADSNVYNFLMNDVATAFECVFIFDTVNKTISAKAIESSTTETDIFLSFDNVIDTASFTEKSDEITTCLAVYGGGSLTIAGVNPLGTNKIYDFSYYMNTNWMSADLIVAIQNWNALILSYQSDYATYLLNLKTALGELLVLQSELSTLQSEYSALESVQKVRIEQGLDISAINEDLAAKGLEINTKMGDITNKESIISSLRASLQDIVASLSFDNNFSPTQLEELNEFIYENTYKNDNIIKTDSMTEEQIQDQQQELYNQGVSVLSRVSQPRYEFDLKSVNYTAISEFSVFTAQTEVGIEVVAEIKDGQYITSVLLELQFNFYDPTDFSMKFSNRVRLDDGNYVYSDLMGSVIRTGSTVSFDSEAWSNWDDEYKNDVTDFINSALDTSRNELINGTNQEITISEVGLRGKSFLTEGVYKPTQVWLTSSILAFTDDNWNSAKLALGQITAPDGSQVFGLAASVIVGNLIAGNSLNISNGSNNFLLNASGAYLNNATLTLTVNNSRIFLDPENAFLIQQNIGGSWTDKFRVTSATGNVTFSGDLSGASGTFTGTISASSGYIGGWTISTDGLYDSTGNYIRSNGNIRLGPLTITGSSGVFDGTFRADQLIGQVANDNITDNLNAGKLTFGTISAGVLFAGEINWGANARMYNYGYGISAISGNRILLMQDDSMDTYIDITGGGISITGSNAVNLNANGGAGTISLLGSIYIDNGAGYGTGDTTIREITTTSGNFYFKFVSGILVDVY